MPTKQSYDRQLEELLSTNASDAVAEQRLAWTNGGYGLLNPTVLHGAGELGLNTLAQLRKTGCEPLCFIDNSERLWGSWIEGIPVMPPVEAVDKWGDVAQFIVTVFNPRAAVTQLIEAGASRVAPWHLMYHGEPDVFLPYACVDRPSTLLNASDRILRLADTFADGESYRLLVEQISWRIAPHNTPMSAGRPIGQLYFDPELVELTSQERFVDCGAFDGDTLDHFLKYSHGSLDRADLIELDPSNLEAMRVRISRLPATTANRIHIHPHALGRESRKQKIAATGTTGSRVTDGEGIEVQMSTLDSLVPPDVTIIKVDVEGAELDVIAGAKEIMANRPTWAVMTYHRPDHLWEVPLALGSARGYDLYMRRYAEDCWETCSYAIPRN